MTLWVQSDPATGGVERERDIITDENAAAGGLFWPWSGSLSLSPASREPRWFEPRKEVKEQTGETRTGA